MDIKLIELACADCGITFYLTDKFDDRLRENHNTFYCPHGHPQSYKGKTEAERLREQVRKLEEDKKLLNEELAKKCAKKVRKSKTK